MGAGSGGRAGGGEEGAAFRFLLALEVVVVGRGAEGEAAFCLLFALVGAVVAVSKGSLSLPLVSAGFLVSRSFLFLAGVVLGGGGEGVPMGAAIVVSLASASLFSSLVGGFRPGRLG